MLLALARFASFYGTGIDTMRGIGQTLFRRGQVERALALGVEDSPSSREWSDEDAELLRDVMGDVFDAVDSADAEKTNYHDPTSARIV
jgi:hypothetical protein